ncbi:MAG: hypothetical protein EOO06_00680 [Chitinophagaceae bacterium]|nr:MAG: hypothetical protein EOO06_00680 [Chitinophagaceae bacterium]
MALSPITGFYDVVNQINTQLAAGTLTPAATTTVNGTVKKAATQANFAGADNAALLVELNAFLAKLKAAGIVA